jgi:hypothetical protein
VAAGLIGKETWTSWSSDVKGDAYEGLLEKNAEDTKSGAGQYFTPRALIDALVDCVVPRPGEAICDPACGTGGFLLSTYHYLATHYDLDLDQKRHLRYNALRGVELVDGVTQLCAMNMLLHGIGPDDDSYEPPIKTYDALCNEPSDHFEVVVTNPPFGKKSSITVVNEEGERDKQSVTYSRPDFWTTTSNKQLNFLQPGLIREGAHIGKRQCDGMYRSQTNPVNGKTSRCALSGKGMRYWDVIPKLFDYDAQVDHIDTACPFKGHGSLGWRVTSEGERGVYSCFAGAASTRRLADRPRGLFCQLSSSSSGGSHPGKLSSR